MDSCVFYEVQTEVLCMIYILVSLKRLQHVTCVQFTDYRVWQSRNMLTQYYYKLLNIPNY